MYGKKITNSLFEEEWWLDAVAQKHWKAIELCDKNGNVYARFPYCIQRRLGHKIISNPIFTQTLGVYIKDTGAKMSKRLGREKEILCEIIEKLPNVSLDIYLDSNNKYFMPFIWNGYKISPAISYQLNNIKDEKKVWSGFKENIKTDVKKAQKILQIKDDLPIDELINIQKKTFERQNRKLPYNPQIIRKIDRIALQRGQRKLLCAVDDVGRVHAAAYFVFDERRCYYLIGGGDPALRNSGAGALLVWEGIKFASTVSEIFDFEGSMIEDIERFFRGFGGEPVVYYRITRLKGLLRIIEYIKPKVKKILKYK